MNQPASSSRRQFVKSTAIAATGLGMAALLPGSAWAGKSDDVDDLDVTINRVLSCKVKYERPRIVAGNSGYRLAGKYRSDQVLVVFGDNGKIGVGASGRGADADNARYLLGKKVSDLLGSFAGEVNQRVGTSAIWDLAGKTLEKPVYQLLGGKAPKDGVPIYDGSIYHEELLARDQNTAYRNPDSKYGRRPSWEDIIKEAVDTSKQANHNFAKIKIGRGKLHLSRKAGNYQDAAVLELIREYAGKDFGIGVDANNGYSLEDTLWLLNECGSLNIAYIEEMFSDDVNKYRVVRKEIKKLGLKTLIADGEGWKKPSDPLVKEIIESGTVDILQADMRRFEFEGILEEARMATQAGHGSMIAPHNFGNDLGFYMSIHVGCAIPNFYRAEHDPGKQQGDTLIKQGYKIVNGTCQNFDAPGLGIELNPKQLGNLATQFDVKK
jgi:L-alanine-DL-glutamate epimerase-like enolase superfamily enzyme